MPNPHRRRARCAFVATKAQRAGRDEGALLPRPRGREIHMRMSRTILPLRCGRGDRQRRAVMQPGATPCNAMQPNATDSSVWKNEPTGTLRHRRRSVQPQSDRMPALVQACNPMKPSETPCNAMQPSATNPAIWKNEPTDPQIHDNFRPRREIWHVSGATSRIPAPRKEHRS